MPGFLDLLINFQKFEDKLHIGHGLPDEAPEGTEEIQGGIHLQDVGVYHHKVTNFECPANNFVISNQQCCEEAERDDSTLGNVEDDETFGDGDIFLLVFAQGIKESFFFMLFSVEIFHSFEVEQRVSCLLVVFSIFLS